VDASHQHVTVLFRAEEEVEVEVEGVEVEVEEEGAFARKLRQSSESAKSLGEIRWLSGETPSCGTTQARPRRAKGPVVKVALLAYEEWQGRGRADL